MKAQSVLAMTLCLAATCTATGPSSRPSASPLSVPRSSSPRAAGLESCPATKRFHDLPAFATGLGAPDDLAVPLDGTMWVSDPAHGTIRHLSVTGLVLQTITDPESPEGMVALSDGRLIVAEQRRNRLVEIHPPLAARTVVLTLPPPGLAEGLDGIAFDAARDEVLVPDSAHGTLLAWPAGGGRARLLARGLGRDVDAAAGPGVEIYVAAEAAPGVLRIRSGRGEAVDALIQADDVVVDGSIMYVTLIGSGKVVAVDLSTGTHRDIVDGIGAAQGLAVMRDGRLAIADSNDGSVRLADVCG